jgi:hypothetical protein
LTNILAQTRFVVYVYCQLVDQPIYSRQSGPFVADVFWGLHGPDGEPRVVYPQGATGEGELLTEMQRRLVDFDNRH